MKTQSLLALVLLPTIAATAKATTINSVGVNGTQGFAVIEVLSKDDSFAPKLNAEDVITSSDRYEIAQFPGSDQFGDTFNPMDIQELIDGLEPLVDPNGSDGPSPGMTFGTPTSSGASANQGFIGVSSAVDFEGPGKNDGSISFGVGMGDPVENVGLETFVNLIGLSDLNDGSIGFKLHKVISTEDRLGIAFGWSNVVDWGKAKKAKETIYGVLTKTFDLTPNSAQSTPLSVSLGIGTGGFRSTGAIADNNNDPNVFGSLGVQLSPDVSLATSWTGSQWNLGMGIAPFDFPLTFTTGFLDITDNTLRGTNFNLNAGYTFRFK